MSKKKTDLILVVRGDYNDADFCTRATPITQKELNRFLPLIEAIKNFKPYKAFGKREEGERGTPIEWTHDNNWPIGEFGYRDDLGCKSITELYGELAEEFDEEYVPNGGEGGGYSLHTIHEIYVVRLEEVLYQKPNNEHGWHSVTV